ncbi:MAG: type IV pilus assembly protein PilM [Candidatus Sericytochromatia bacterium]
MKLFGKEITPSSLSRMLKNPFAKEPPIGIDITNEFIIAVELSPVKNQPGVIELTRLATTNTPENAVRDGEVVDPARVAEKIKTLIAEHEFKSRKVITAVSGQAAIIRPRIKFPAIPLKELKEVVMHDAERYIPFPIQDVYIDFQVTGTVDEEGVSKYDVLLVTAQKQLIDTYIETFALADMQLVSVDVASFAVMRALAEDAEEETLNVLILIRGETTDLTVIQNGAPLFARSIPMGSSTFIETIASNMGLELEEAVSIFDRLIIPVVGDEEFDDPMVEQAAEEIRFLLKDLTNEIQKSIEYFHQSQQEYTRIQHLILSDRGAKIKNLDQYFSHQLGIDVEISNPIKHLTFDESVFSLEYLSENAPLFATAIGLARRGIEEP